MMMPKLTPQAVLWDMDGTLVDTEPYWLASERDYAQSLNSVWDEQLSHQLVGLSLYETAKILKTKYSLGHKSDQEVIDDLTSGVVSRLQHKLPFRPGALELLSELKANGIKTALVTMSMFSMASSIVEKIEFEAFDSIVSGDQVSRGKPDPEPYLKAAELLAVDITQCVALEDSSTGLSSAEASGALAIGIPNIVDIPSRPGRILIDSLEDLNLETLSQLLGDRNAKA